MIKVYVSGQITGTDDFMDRFSAAEKKLTEQGYSVINPAKVNAQMPEDTSYDGYMEMSQTMLKQADVIYMLKGWELSNGANTEFAWALEWGKMIMFEEPRYIAEAFEVINAAERSKNKYAYKIGNKVASN